MKTAKRIERLTLRALRKFAMISSGDRLLLGLSGGKDSWLLLELLANLQRRLPFALPLMAVHVLMDDYKQELASLQKRCAELEIPFYLIERYMEPLARDAKRPGSSFCSFCARQRRGAIYDKARELQANKVVLAHHREDLLETVLMNMLYAGQIKSMAPAYRIDAGDLWVIRPLIYVPEDLIIEQARLKRYPVLGYVCPHQKEKDGGIRREVKEWLNHLAQKNSQVKGNLLHSLENVAASHLLDTSLYDFGKQRRL
jgi:tRNA 2-thiocytidine biosynthesis protein TtcA